MKKSFIILLSMLFVLGSFAAVSADDGGMDSVRSAVAGSKVVIGGDAYVEGYWLGNHDLDDTVDADDRFWNQRVRLKIHAAIGGVEVRTRLTTGDDVWNGANNTGGNVTVDYAYLHVPVFEVVTLDFGRQKSDWGNKLLQWNANRDRAKVTVDAVENVSFGVYTDKIEEIDAIGDDNLVDRDDYALFAIANLGNVEAGALAVMITDGREEVVGTQDGLGGNLVSLYGNADIAGVGISAELAVKMGDIFAYTDLVTLEEIDDPQIGFFASGEYALGQITLNGLLGLTMNGYVADNHFNPTVMIGTDQTTAIMEFGGLDIGGMGATSDLYLLAATASFAARDDLSVYGRAAYAMGQELVGKPTATTGLVPDDSDLSMIEVDAGLEFQIADNTTFNLDFGYMMLDVEIEGTDEELDAAFSVGQSINIVF